eukprot:2579947-Lingulodinium_polyedra.AAC.1
MHLRAFIPTRMHWSAGCVQYMMHVQARGACSSQKQHHDGVPLSLDRASSAMDSTSSTASEAVVSPGLCKTRYRVSNKKVTHIAMALET